MKRSNMDADARISTLGERIKAIRMNWKWSQEAMAGALRVDQASISFWERDKIKPSGSAMVALSSLFRISPTALEEGVGFRIPESPSSPGSVETDQEQPRSVSLPMGGEGGVMVVDLGDGSSRDRSLSEAMMSLVQGLKENRRVWIVLG